MLGKVILLVTSDKAASRRLASCLRGAGNDVLHAQSSEAAAGLIGARAVDLVLVDGEGEGAIAVLEAAAGRVPAVVLSTSGRATIVPWPVASPSSTPTIASFAGKRVG